MAQLTLHQRKFIIEGWNKFKSLGIVQREFRRVYNKNVSKRGIARIRDKWQEHAIVQNMNRGRSGRKRTGRSDANIATVDNFVSSNTVCTVRKLSASSGISHASLHRILKLDLKFKAYKPQIAQKISETDKEKRLEFCNKILMMHETDEINIKNVIFSDESHVYLHVSPNKQNFRRWARTKPEFIYDKSLHSPKVTVCGVACLRIKS